jgi:hypothetical protein
VVVGGRGPIDWSSFAYRNRPRQRHTVVRSPHHVDAVRTRRTDGVWSPVDQLDLHGRLSRALRFVIERPALADIVQVTSPNPIRNRDMMAALRSALHPSVVAADSATTGPSRRSAVAHGSGAGTHGPTMRSAHAAGCGIRVPDGLRRCDLQPGAASSDVGPLGRAERIGPIATGPDQARPPTDHTVRSASATAR